MRSRSKSLKTALPWALAALSAALLGVSEGDSIEELGPGKAGFLAHAPPALGPIHAQAIAVAETYLFKGLVEHNPASSEEVLLADDATRAEQGRVNATSADQIRTALGTGAGLKIITGIKNIRWFVECNRDVVCEAVAFYDLEVNANGPAPPVLIAERFRVANGLIEEIEAIFVIHGDATRCSGACFPASELGHEAP